MTDILIQFNKNQREQEKVTILSAEKILNLPRVKRFLYEYQNNVSFVNV